MKKLYAITLAAALLLAGCGAQSSTASSEAAATEAPAATAAPADSTDAAAEATEAPAAAEAPAATEAPAAAQPVAGTPITRVSSFDCTGSWDAYRGTFEDLDAAAGTHYGYDLINENSGDGVPYTYDPATGELTASNTTLTLQYLDDGIYKIEESGKSMYMVGEAGAKVENGGTWIGLDTTAAGDITFNTDGTVTLNGETFQGGRLDDRDEFVIFDEDGTITDDVYFEILNGLVVCTWNDEPNGTYTMILLPKA